MYRLVALILLLTLVNLPSDASSQEVRSEAQALFEREEGEGGFGYRIPTIVQASNGDLLAFCERRVGVHDHAHNDIVLRRSSDGGATWGSVEVIHDAGIDVLVDPAPIALPDGRVVLFYQRFPDGYHARRQGRIQMLSAGWDNPATCSQQLIRISDDNGATWSDAVDVTAHVRTETAMTAATPNAGIFVEEGPHAGRIVYATYEMSQSDLPIAFGGRVSQCNLVYSDDRGETWHRGEATPIMDDGNPNESAVVELPGGDLFVVARNQNGGQRVRRTMRTSDGGQTWQDHQQHPDLSSAVCQGSLARAEVGGQRVILSLQPTGRDLAGDQRSNGTLFLSTDQGETFPHHGVLIPGGFAYASMQVLHGGDLVVLYERPYSAIEFQRIPAAEWQSYLREE